MLQDILLADACSSINSCNRDNMEIEVKFLG